MKMSWSLKLLETMNDPQSIVYKTERVVVIRDKFPKAKQHFLVLPYEKIDTIFDLKKNHIELVNEIEACGLKAIKLTGKKREIFKLGFHADPSMMR